MRGVHRKVRITIDFLYIFDDRRRRRREQWNREQINFQWKNYWTTENRWWQIWELIASSTRLQTEEFVIVQTSKVENVPDVCGVSVLLLLWLMRAIERMWNNRLKTFIFQWLPHDTDNWHTSDSDSLSVFLDLLSFSLPVRTPLVLIRNDFWFVSN